MGTRPLGLRRRRGLGWRKGAPTPKQKDYLVLHGLMEDYGDDEAREFVKKHDLGFLDLCEMVYAFSETMKYGMIKWDRGRCLIHIKMERKKRTG